MDASTVLGLYNILRNETVRFQEDLGIMREFLDLSLTIEAEAPRNAIDLGARKLIYNILLRDNGEHEKVVRLKEAKGWTDYDLPPYLAPAQ